ncbi:MAG: methylmalonyl-CoA mutase family protein, partial [Rhodospirillales bacterium]|nr:methylmalonyl-CoA mutase family protein [Rhodospirillales bacterium]
AQPELFRVSEEVQQKQIDKLSAVKGKRDHAKVEKALGAIRDAAAGKDNLMPLILDAVREYATIGEISAAMQDVFGEYTETFN